MIIDEELDNLARQRAEHKDEEVTETATANADEGDNSSAPDSGLPVVSAEQNAPVSAVNIPQPRKTLADRMDEVNEAILQQAAVEDENFVKTIKKNVKEAAVTHTEVERESAELSKQEVIYAQEKVDTKRKKNVHEAAEDKWANREKRREFHFNGVRPIMEFVGITKPLNLFFLYLLTLILLPFFLLSKLWRGTVGALISGAEDENRAKGVKGFLWTIIGVFAAAVLAAAIYLFLKWQAII